MIVIDFERVQYLMRAWPLPTRGQWEELQKLIPELITALVAASSWTLVEDQLPEMAPGLPSRPVLVCVHEFGQKPAIAVARCWQSSEKGQPLHWYLDPDIYHLERPMPIAEQVIAWKAILSPLDAVVLLEGKHAQCAG